MRDMGYICMALTACATLAAAAPDASFGNNDWFVNELRDLATYSVVDGKLVGYSDVLLAEHEYKTANTVTYVDANIISYRIESSGYSGGAHGWRNVIVGTLDRRTGNRLTIGDIASPAMLNELMRRIVESLIRQRGAVNYDDLVNNKLLNKPFLTGNFYYDKDKLNFVFNEYEIDCYANGICTVSVDWPRPAGLEASNKVSTKNP